MWKTLSIGVKKDKEIHFYDVVFDQHEDLNGFCDVLSEYILNKYQNKLVIKTLNKNYCYLTSNERKEAYENAKRILANEHGKNRVIIKNKLIEYISLSDTIIIDGFIAFRLNEYINKLELAADRAVEILIAKKEYDEFIDLLRFFVDIQNPVINTIHVLRIEEKYVMLDSSYNEISNECIDDFLNEMRYGTINYDDLLLSTLITLAPKNIYIHQVYKIENKELLSTLKKVFENRIKFCNDCSLCNGINGAKDFNKKLDFFDAMPKNRLLSHIKSDL
ncbi:MAG: putative sporulation protein YtxC [Clostridia bacterium]|nr:putative sporulation protein YtxC [Clostridia bacterium]